MRTTTAWDSLQKSVGHLYAFLIDNLTVIGAFTIVGLSALVVQKSVEKLQMWGIPSLLIAAMEILHACIWVMDALAVLWLCGTAAIKFCKQVTGGK